MGFLDQLKQLNELKSKMDEVKKRLDSLEVTEDSMTATVRVNGNRKITAIELKQPLQAGSQAALTETINAALAKSEDVMQREMMGAMPKIPGL